MYLKSLIHLLTSALSSKNKFYIPITFKVREKYSTPYNFSTGHHAKTSQDKFLINMATSCAEHKFLMK